MRPAYEARAKAQGTRQEAEGRRQKGQGKRQRATKGGRQTGAWALAAAMSLLATPAFAQGVSLGGVAWIGNTTFSAKDSFEAVFGTSSGMIDGAGAQLLLPGGIYVELTTSVVNKDGSVVVVGCRCPRGRCPGRAQRKQPWRNDRSIEAHPWPVTRSSRGV